MAYTARELQQKYDRFARWYDWCDLIVEVLGAARGRRALLQRARGKVRGRRGHREEPALLPAGLRHHGGRPQPGDARGRPPARASAGAARPLRAHGRGTPRLPRPRLRHRGVHHEPLHHPPPGVRPPRDGQGVPAGRAPPVPRARAERPGVARPMAGPDRREARAPARLLLEPPAARPGPGSRDPGRDRPEGRLGHLPPDRGGTAPKDVSIHASIPAYDAGRTVFPTIRAGDRTPGLKPDPPAPGRTGLHPPVPERRGVPPRLGLPRRDAGTRRASASAHAGGGGLGPSRSRRAFPDSSRVGEGRLRTSAAPHTSDPAGQSPPPMPRAATARPGPYT